MPHPFLRRPPVESRRARLAAPLGLALLSAACASTSTPSADAPASAPGAPAAVSAAAASIAELDLNIPYTKMVLENGLTLIVHEDRRTPTVTFHLWYHVGSKNEPEGRSGFAHLFEHLMFNGSENFNDDFFKATQKIGASNQNGTTSTDRTNYFQTVPKEALDSILWLESDRMGFLLGAVDQAKLDEQRGVVKNEKRQSENQPYGQVNNRIVAATWPDEHPYGHTVIGSMEDLDAASLADVRDWFRTWYGPSNSILVLAGDISPEEAKAKVEKYFGEIPPGPPVSQPKSWVPRLANNQREEMFDRVAAPRIYRIWNVPELGHPDGEPLDVFAYALGGDRNARLTKRLVHDEQIATGVSVGNGQSELAGQFRVVVTAKPDADLAYIERVIEEEMARLIAEGPTAAELSKVKVQTVRGIVDTLELNPAKASLLATWETFTDDPDGWKTSLRRLQAATPQQVSEVAREWLTGGSYTLVVKPFGDYSASQAKVDRSAMPMPTSIAPATFPDYQTETLSNGMKVLLVERRDAPLVNVTLAVETGYGADWAQQKPGAGDLAVSLLDEGTQRRTALQIAEELDQIGAGLGAGYGGEVSSVSMSSLTSTLDQALDIFADVTRNPAFRAADFERVQKQSIENVRQSFSSPNSIASIVGSAKTWGEEHPYGRMVTPEAVAALTREDAAAFHRRWFGANNATLIVVGDTTMADIKPKLEAEFGDWGRAEGEASPTPERARPAQDKVYIVDRPGSVQSVIRVSAPLPAAEQPGSDFPAMALNGLFGGNFTSRINMNLREAKGWSYGARTSISGGEGPRQFVLSAPVQTDATKGALSEIRRELREIVGARPPSVDELQAAKNSAVLGLASRWETGAAVAQSLSSIVADNLPPDYFKRYAARFNAVTPQQVADEAREVIGQGGLVWVVVGDRSKIEADVRSLNLGAVEVVDARGRPLP
jgi:zinc protease